jgi:putative nucleotidyltransferase with HDIG domain
MDNILLLPPEKIKKYRNWFSTYSASFQNLSEKQMKNIELKIHHTYEVCNIILDIGKSLNLTDEELHVAEAIALFHDIGRFEQISRFNTFSDAHSMDHGDFGVEVLKEFKIIEDLNEYTQDIIYNSLEYHNKLLLPEIER